MGRGTSAGGGQSSLGYLFGGGEPTKSTPASQNQGTDLNTVTSQKSAAPSQSVDNSKQIQTGVSDSKPTGPSQSVDNSKQIPAGIHDSKTNNYLRSEGQNCGNFITDRPSTKVHAAPGGSSSLGYLFGDGKN